jgi:hypothetical protein
MYVAVKSSSLFRTGLYSGMSRVLFQGWVILSSCCYGWFCCQFSGIGAVCSCVEVLCALILIQLVILVVSLKVLGSSSFELKASLFPSTRTKLVAGREILSSLGLGGALSFCFQSCWNAFCAW